MGGPGRGDKYLYSVMFTIVVVLGRFSGARAKVPPLAFSMHPSSILANCLDPHPIVFATKTKPAVAFVLRKDERILFKARLKYIKS
jgi:hypothetical protein